MSSGGPCRLLRMATNEPTAKNLADLYHLAPLDWDDVRSRFEAGVPQAPGDGGPDHHSFWLSTIDADGRPHMTGVGVHWIDGRCYFSGSPRSRKIRNLERDPRCAFGVAVQGYDVALEGRAERVTDEALLQRVADVFAAGGWAPTVADGGFTHDYSAPSAGPPPWYVYAFTPEDAYAVMTTEPGGATRWTF
jgi:hypothetical protein